MKGDGREVHAIPRWRYYMVVALLSALPLILLAKIARLQIMPSAEGGREFLQDQGEARTVRTVPIAAHRGTITDRNGTPLAVSTPVTTLVANPRLLLAQASADDLGRLARSLGLSIAQLGEKLRRYQDKSFMYLDRQLPASDADKVLNLELPGIYGQQEYKRFYPAGEVAAQLIGFTDIADHGQEGMELAYDAELRGAEGARKVIKDRAGRVIKDIAQVREARPGQPLQLSIDLRVQYAAYRALKAAVRKHNAKAGSVVVLDVQTGEVLAMANQPSFNPNDRSHLQAGATRNRAMTDMLEPGSTVKPFTVLAALESGKFRPDTTIDTSPGYVRVERKTFYDHLNYGVLDLAGILTKSSQVGTTKMALDLDPEMTREVFERVGFGEAIGSGFPSETPGNLPDYRKWSPVVQATFAFGYGLSVSAAQLARAYTVLANDGERRDISLLKLDRAPDAVLVAEARQVREVRSMLQHVVSDEGTGKRAEIEGYTVAGKTGTSHKVAASGGYDAHRYMSVFAGMAPLDDPRLVAVVVVDEPRGKDYFGGLVAAPVFSAVTGDALRLLQVTPDAVPASDDLAASISRAQGREDS